ncbi:MAG: PAS domain S-box protein [Acidobacteriota bacterium]|nr:PAS domain S-box protein [Acidobacteriota bacterium]
MLDQLVFPTTVIATENLYRTLFEASPLMYFVLDAEGVILSVNQSVVERLGYSEDELIGYSYFELFHEDDRPKLKQQIEFLPAINSKTAQGELRKIHKNGDIVYVSENVRMIREETGESLFLVVCEDVTERRATLNALTESQKRYKAVIEKSSVAIFAYDRFGIITFSEGAALEKLGFKNGELIGKSVFDLYCGNPQVLQNVRRALNGENFTAVGEANNVVFETHFNPLYDSNGRFAGVCGVSTDITETKLAEKALRESEQRYRTFIDQCGEGIWRIEFTKPISISLPVEKQIELYYKHGYLAECNDAMARMYGYETAADLINVSLEKLIIRSDPENQKYLATVIESDYKIFEIPSHERGADGSDKYFLNNLVGIIENGYLVRLWGTQRDITERVLTEQKLVEAVRQLETFVEREALVTRISNEVRQSLRLDEVFQTIVDELGEHLAVDRCILYLFDNDGNLARAAAGFARAENSISPDEFHVPLPLTQSTVNALLNNDYVAFNDVSNEPAIEDLYEGVLRPRGVKSLMCVAIRVGSAITGVITFTTLEEIRHWNEADSALARAVADKAAIAIRQAELYQRTEATSRREKLINHLSTAIRASLQLPEVLYAATHELGKTLAASRVFLHFYDPANPAREVPPEYEFVSPNIILNSLPPASYEDVLGRKLLADRQTIVVHDIENFVSANAELSEHIRSLAQKSQVKSAIYCPLVVNDQFRGTLCIQQNDHVRRWTEDEIALIENVAVQLSLGITQAELFEFTRRAKREWEATFDAMSDGVFIFNRERRLIRLNRAGALMEGATPRQLLGKNCCEMLTSENHDNDRCVVQQVLSGKRRITVERISTTTRRPLLITAEPLIDETGELIGVVSTVRDLHELRQAESFAREKERLLSQVLEGIVEPNITISTEGRLLRCNQATVTTYGCAAPENLLGRHFLEMVHPEDVGTAQRFLRAALEEAAPQNFEARFLSDSGETRDAVFNSVPLVEGGKIIGALWFIRDVTAQKRAYERAAQADKLRALGKLASGVAHDFNNGLAAILGRVQLLRERVPDEALNRDLRVIQTAAEDAAATVRRIQTFARQTPTGNFEPADACSLVRDAVEIMRTRWENEAQRRGVKYDLEIDCSEELYVLCNPSELREVFVNLIVNALDAMPDGGRLKIRCQSEREAVAIYFADSGAGMDEETQKRVFEPFFTTKGVNGTGLGLSVSYSIVEAHNGKICVKSEIGKGTRFRIELPKTECEKAKQNETKKNLPEIPKLSILVVDDDESVRFVLEEMLVELEQQVVSVSSGSEALEKLSNEHFDAVFTDLSMPEMDGWQLAREIRRRYEAVKIVLVTGHGEGAQPDSELENKPIEQIIGKPFDLKQLAETLGNLRNENGE